MMWTCKRKCALITAVMAVAVGIGCTGFFQNPTVSSLTVSPTSNNLQIGQTAQLSAIANNNDGSTKDVTGLAVWQSSDTTGTIVTVSSTGLVKALQNTTSSVTITATYKGFSGTATVSVGGQTVTITCSSCTNNTISLTTNGGAGSSVGLSSSVAANWSSSNSGVITVSGSATTTPTASLGGSTGAATITATASSGSGSGTLTITVTQ